MEVFYSNKQGRPWSYASLPVALHVCRESRHETLKFFQLLYPETLHSPSVYFRHKIDTIYFSMPHISSPSPPDRGEYLPALFGGIRKNVLRNLKHIAVDLSAYLDLELSEENSDYFQNIRALLTFQSLESLSIVAGRSLRSREDKRQKLAFVELMQANDGKTMSELGDGQVYECVCCQKPHSMCQYYPCMQDIIQKDMEQLGKFDKEKRRKREILTRTPVEHGSAYEDLREMDKPRQAIHENERSMWLESLILRRRTEFESSWEVSPAEAESPSQRASANSLISSFDLGDTLAQQYTTWVVSGGSHTSWEGSGLEASEFSRSRIEKEVEQSEEGVIADNGAQPQRNLNWADPAEFTTTFEDPLLKVDSIDIVSGGYKYSHRQNRLCEAHDKAWMPPNVVGVALCWVFDGYPNDVAKS